MSSPLRARSGLMHCNKKVVKIPIFYRHETLSFRPYGHRAMRLQ
jgi:hypothetical protein